MDFVAIDFETANEEKSSVCALGLVVVRAGKIVQKNHWLVRPPRLYFNPFNTAIHGITEAAVKHKPQFDELWESVNPYFRENTIVAHYAGFDIGVLRNVLNEYGIVPPEIDYSCSRNIAREVWRDRVSYGLASVAGTLGITFTHHNAEEDARACSLIVTRAAQEISADSIDDLADKLGLVHGRLHPGGCWPCRTKRAGRSEVVPTTSDFDARHPFFGKTLVFTGALRSMGRRDAMQKVVDTGGYCSDSISQQVSFLVVGKHRVNDGVSKRTAKMRKVEQLISAGCAIEVVEEEDFLRLLSS